MTIKNGYNSKPLTIRISGRRDEESAELWIIQEGLPGNPELIKYKETLSYITVHELFALKQEIERAVKDMFGIN